MIEYTATLRDLAEPVWHAIEGSCRIEDRELVVGILFNLLHTEAAASPPAAYGYEKDAELVEAHFDPQTVSIIAEIEFSDGKVYEAFYTFDGEKLNH